MTVRCLLARKREGGSGSDGRKQARMVEFRLVKSNKTSRIKTKSAMNKLFAWQRLYTNEGQKVVETL